jgi:hypothetical protein
MIVLEGTVRYSSFLRVQILREARLMRVAVNLFSCSPNGDLKMWDMRAFKVRAFSFSARSVSPFCPLSFVFKFNRLLQNTLSMAGVGDGITSMAVHPHLPILAIGSMGQVSHPARRCI